MRKILRCMVGLSFIGASFIVNPVAAHAFETCSAWKDTTIVGVKIRGCIGGQGKIWKQGEIDVWNNSGSDKFIYHTYVHLSSLAGDVTCRPGWLKSGYMHPCYSVAMQDNQLFTKDWAIGSVDLDNLGSGGFATSPEVM